MVTKSWTQLTSSLPRNAGDTRFYWQVFNFCDEVNGDADNGDGMIKMATGLPRAAGRGTETRRHPSSRLGIYVTNSGKRWLCSHPGQKGMKGAFFTELYFSSHCHGILHHWSREVWGALVEGQLLRLHAAVGILRRRHCPHTWLSSQQAGEEASSPTVRGPMLGLCHPRGSLALLLLQMHWASMELARSASPSSPAPALGLLLVTGLPLETTFSRLTCRLAPARVRCKAGGRTGRRGRSMSSLSSLCFGWYL